MQIDAQSLTGRTAASLMIGLLAACGGGGTYSPPMPHGVAPPYVVAFQLHYDPPTGAGAPSTLRVTPYGEDTEIASDGVASARLFLFGHDTQLVALSVSAPGGVDRYDFDLPEDFTPGAFPCGVGQGLSVVTVTSNYGHVLSQTFEVCPGPSVDFPPIYGYF